MCKNYVIQTHNKSLQSWSLINLDVIETLRLVIAKLVKNMLMN